MDNPYRKPSADLTRSEVSRRQLMPLAVAFLSALSILPLILFAIATLALGFRPGWGSAAYWGFITLGGVLAACFSFFYRQIPWWGAVLAGPAAVLLMLLVRMGWLVWSGQLTL